MTNAEITEDEKKLAHNWLTRAQRFLALCRGQVKNCKKRNCKSTGMCSAEDIDHASERNICGLPPSEGEVAQTVELALFGMMLEEGLLSREDETDH